jgi:serine protease Do
MSGWKWLILGCMVGGLYAAAGPMHLGWRDVVSALSSVAREEGPAARRLPDFTDLVERVGPAVVNVTTRSLPRAIPSSPSAAAAERHFELYRGLAGEDETSQQPVLSIGSGFIVRNDGYIITNAHVVADADEVYVRLTGRSSEMKARIVGTDPATDIALLKIQASHLPVVRTGNSEALKVGDWVAAIGSPFGFDNTITAGIVSAKERRLAPGAGTPFLQSDVAVNPGSSGGPLVNLNGEVVGVNSKIYTRTGGYMGVSFAIPIEAALRVGDVLRARGGVDPGFVGLETQHLTPMLAASFGVKAAQGALVSAVKPGSPAVAAGIRPGDVILAFAGRAIDGPDQLSRAISAAAPGKRKSMTIWRRGARVVVPVMVGRLPEETAAYAAGVSRQKEAIDVGPLQLSEVPPEQCRALQVPYGLVVEGWTPHATPRALQRGDIILAVNDQPFTSASEFERLLDRRNSSVPVALLVSRASRARYVALEAF